MKSYFLLKLLLIFLLLEGCGIGGFWMEGNPFQGKTSPYGTYWIKEGMTVEQRRMDSWECGATHPEIREHAERAADHVIFSKEKLQKERRQDENNDFASRSRLTKAWIRCMQAKGYYYEK